MRAPQTIVALERKQREALGMQRADLWQLAYRGFQTNGRGWIVADGSRLGQAQPMVVRWRSGREILNARGNLFGWAQQAAGYLRDYDPRREFVLQYISPQTAIQVYRVPVPPSARRAPEKAVAPIRSATEEASDC